MLQKTEVPNRFQGGGYEQKATQVMFILFHDISFEARIYLSVLFA